VARVLAAITGAVSACRRAAPVPVGRTGKLTVLAFGTFA
jgi:hypothetical protein